MHDTPLLEAYFRYVTNWDHIIAEHRVCNIYRCASNIYTVLVLGLHYVLHIEAVYLCCPFIKIHIWVEVEVKCSQRSAETVCLSGDAMISISFWVSLYKMQASHFHEPIYRHMYSRHDESDMNSEFSWKLFPIAKCCFMFFLLLRKFFWRRIYVNRIFKVGCALCSCVELY